MTTKNQPVFEAALALPEAERFELVEMAAHIVCLMFGCVRPATWIGFRLQDVLASIDWPFTHASFFSWDTTQTRERERFFETLPSVIVRSLS